MTDNQKYAYYTRVTWTIYTVLILVLACVLVFVVARDTEEMFFYGFMTLASGYVFRPTDRFISKLVYKYTGVSNPAENE